MSAASRTDPGEHTYCREFVCRIGPDGRTRGLAPLWLERHGIERDAAQVARLALAPLPAPGAYAERACESAGARLYLQFDENCPLAACVALGEELAHILFESLLEGLALPALRTEAIEVAPLVRTCIRAAASRALALVLDELDDRYLPKLERMNWRELAPALQSHVEAGFERARREHARVTRPVLERLEHELHQAMTGRLAPGTRLTVRVNPARGQAWLESASAS